MLEWIVAHPWQAWFYVGLPIGTYVALQITRDPHQGERRSPEWEALLWSQRGPVTFLAILICTAIWPPLLPIVLIDLQQGWNAWWDRIWPESAQRRHQ